MRNFPLLALTAAFVLSCAPTLQNGTFDDGQVRYRVGAPGDGWREIQIDNANAAWFHDDANAALLVNSHCEGVDDAPLEALTRHLSIGMTDSTIIGERKFELSRREALETELSAKLDGVPRHLLILVLKKDGCVYDVVLDASPATIERARPGFERVREGFDVDARPSRSSST